MTRSHNQSSDLPFDDSAGSLVGGYILVGITYLDDDGKILRQQQLHGIIQSASREGILVRLKGSYEGETWNMPPDLRCIRRAKPGRYQLHASDETVENPDFVATLTRRERPKTH